MPGLDKDVFVDNVALAVQQGAEVEQRSTAAAAELQAAARGKATVVCYDDTTAEEE